MTPQEARALTMAYELHRLLGELCEQPQNGRGSCTEAAWDSMDSVIEMLEPDPRPESIEVSPTHRVRLVKR